MAFMFGRWSRRALRWSLLIGCLLLTTGLAARDEAPTSRAAVVSVAEYPTRSISVARASRRARVSQAPAPAPPASHSQPRVNLDRSFRRPFERPLYLKHRALLC